MSKKFVLLILAAFLSCSIAATHAAPGACQGCTSDAADPSIREQIKADRAREVERLARESPARPWDKKDFSQRWQPVEGRSDH